VQHLTLPPFARAALLLDMDGTLLDIAPTPDAVVVPQGLIADLRALRTRLGGALAVVTGRPIAQVDALLGDAPYAVAGEHGGAIRHAPGQTDQHAVLPEPPADWLATGKAIAAAHPGALLERKARGFVLHYRAAPEHGPALQRALQALMQDTPGFAVLPARMAWELKPLGADKGTAVAALMNDTPFTGRLPIFIGDDVTDEDGMAAATHMGGAGLRVDEAFGTAQAVRNWLAAAARDGAWPPLPGPTATVTGFSPPLGSASATPPDVT
jgi:trehalose 6-phosphate phosphatase